MTALKQQHEQPPHIDAQQSKSFFTAYDSSPFASYTENEGKQLQQVVQSLLIEPISLSPLF